MVDPNLPHRRFNPLTGDWILVSPHRNKRPWNGATERPQAKQAPDHDPACYLCPGNRRANGQINPDYKSTFVFTNDHAALVPDAGAGEEAHGDLFIAQQENGASRVICYSRSHARTMAQLSTDQIVQIVDAWKQEYETLGASPAIGHVQIFENKGLMMGASSPHPHGQIWASAHVPTIPAKEEEAQRAYRARHKRLLLERYLADELVNGVRLIGQNGAFAVLSPYWATWPYETMILPKKHLKSLSDFTQNDRRDFAGILRSITRAYDRVFGVSFPYSMGIHQAPTSGAPYDEWQLHVHFYPPLLRSATIKKHYVGYELAAEGQRDMSPEAAAQTLRDLYE